HWPDRDAPPRNQATSQVISRIERSLRRAFLFSKTRRRCCGRFLFGLLNCEGNFAAPFSSKPKLHLNRPSVEVRWRDWLATSTELDLFYGLFSQRFTYRCTATITSTI